MSEDFKKLQESRIYEASCALYNEVLLGIHCVNQGVAERALKDNVACCAVRLHRAITATCVEELENDKFYPINDI